MGAAGRSENDTLSVNLDDDIVGEYIVYGFSNDTGYFVADTMANGEAYWLAISFDEIATVEVPGTTPASTVSRDLDWGWNFIGYPFDEGNSIMNWTVDYESNTYTMAEALDDSLIVPVVHTSWAITNQAPIPFDAGTDLDPWDGFRFLARWEGVTLNMTVPPPGPPEIDDADEADPSAWNLHFVANVDGNSVSAARVGPRLTRVPYTSETCLCCKPNRRDVPCAIPVRRCVVITREYVKPGQAAGHAVIRSPAILGEKINHVCTHNAQVSYSKSHIPTRIR